MVTLGFRATSPESQKARKISVMKKILEERSKMFSHDVGKILSLSATLICRVPPIAAAAVDDRCNVPGITRRVDSVQNDIFRQTLFDVSTRGLSDN
mmetsp:Transcript_21735/g.35854  ORF Transcript_21735/g.35854 Transcript_21735/m.35854 type:complete len:96 (-) Transcript_21735:38-325(-)